MTEQTRRWSLPLLAAGQAQKEMTHNEALTRLDLMVQPAVVRVGENTPPAAVQEGECWIIGDSPTAEWSGYPRALTGWTGGGWRFVLPQEGLQVWDCANGSVCRFHDGAWRSGEVRATRVIVGGHQVVGPQTAAIADPVGGLGADGEARAAIASILAALRGHGLIAV